MKNTKDQKVSVYGASGYAKVVIDCLISDPKKELGHVFDDNPKVETLLNYPVYSPGETKKLRQFPIVFGIGNNRIRRKLANQLDTEFTEFIHHDQSIISEHSKIGVGSVVMPEAILNAGSSIGKHCIINTSAVIEHDCEIQDFTHISPNVALAGGVFVGEGAQLGIGAQVIQGVKIGAWAMVGAGAVIIDDVPEGATVVGNPGKILS
jgi:acetyltransferase EpsM